MPKTINTTFNINVPSVNLNAGDKIILKFKLVSNTTNNFTASLPEQGSLKISSLASGTGYATTTCPYLDVAAISAANNEIVFNIGVSSFYDNGNYIFVPNPSSGIPSNIYDVYGDVDYPFLVKPYDLVLIYLSDGTYIESRIISTYKNAGKLHLVLDTTLSQFVKDDLSNTGHIYKRILFLTRIEDETNAYIVYTKRPGQTSYGFVIPQNLAPDVLANIDVITKEVKQKLLADQSVIDAISGGTFG